MHRSVYCNDQFEYYIIATFVANCIQFVACLVFDWYVHLVKCLILPRLMKLCQHVGSGAYKSGIMLNKSVHWLLGRASQVLCNFLRCNGQFSVWMRRKTADCDANLAIESFTFSCGYERGIFRNMGILMYKTSFIIYLRKRMHRTMQLFASQLFSLLLCSSTRGGFLLSARRSCIFAKFQCIHLDSMYSIEYSSEHSREHPINQGKLVHDQQLCVAFHQYLKWKMLP